VLDIPPPELTLPGGGKHRKTGFFASYIKILKS
jgi:hypothetical protein